MMSENATNTSHYALNGFFGTCCVSAESFSHQAIREGELSCKLKFLLSLILVNILMLSRC